MHEELSDSYNNFPFTRLKQTDKSSKMAMSILCEVDNVERLGSVALDSVNLYHIRGSFVVGYIKYYREYTHLFISILHWQNC